MAFSIHKKECDEMVDMCTSEGWTSRVNGIAASSPVAAGQVGVDKDLGTFRLPRLPNARL